MLGGKKEYQGLRTSRRAETSLYLHSWQSKVKEGVTAGRCVSLVARVPSIQKNQAEAAPTCVLAMVQSKRLRGEVASTLCSCVCCPLALL